MHVLLQPRFRSMWERYCRGVQAIVFVADAADHDNLDAARQELHDLLQKPSLAGIPLLVLGNKSDLPGALSTNDLIDRLELKVGQKGQSIHIHACRCICTWLALTTCATADLNLLFIP